MGRGTWSRADRPQSSFRCTASAQLGEQVIALIHGAHSLADESPAIKSWRTLKDEQPFGAYYGMQRLDSERCTLNLTLLYVLSPVRYLSQLVEVSGRLVG